MSALHPCSSCGRHVRLTENACPFCGSTLALAHVAPRPMPTQRLGRAAAFAFGAAVAASTAGCGTSTTAEGDAGTDAYYGSLDAAYGGPPIDAGNDAVAIAAYGGPPIDAAVVDDAAIVDADLPDVWGAALYGAPPPPPAPEEP